jgi:hypothetical protein
VGHRSWFVTPIAVPDLPVPRFAARRLADLQRKIWPIIIAHLNRGVTVKRKSFPEGIAELHRPVAKVMGFGSEMGEYGMGWIVEETSQGRRIIHKGTCPDFFAYMALLPEQKKGIVLLANANHLIIDSALLEVGEDAASLLAGGQPKPHLTSLDVIPWALRGLLLIPLFQIAGVAITLGLLRRWRQDPQHRPSKGRVWGQHILLPLVPNLALAAIPIALWASGLQRSIMLYMPDFSWIVLICGGFAAIWAFLRTRLILGTLRKPSSPQAIFGQLGAEPGINKP